MAPRNGSAAASEPLGPGELGLLRAGFAIWRERSRALRAADPSWPVPRLPLVAVVLDPERVRPYVPMLNRSTVALYREDLDPARSHPELVAFALARYEWMGRDGHVGLASVRSAAWWLAVDRDAADAFARAARASRSPEARTWRRIAEALPWLRALHHHGLRPPPAGRRVRSLPPTGLLVPAELVSRPPALAAAAGGLAAERVDRFRAAQRPGPAAAGAAARLVARLERERPFVRLVAGDRVLYDPLPGPDAAELGARLAAAAREAVAGLEEELAAIDRVGAAFRSRFGEPEPARDLPDLERGGYTWLDPSGPILTLDLDEPELDRLGGPPLPFAVPMVAARAAHEWGHLAAHRGAVAPEPAEAEAAERELAAAFAALVRRAPARLSPRGDPEGLGWSLTRTLLARLPDLRANLVAARLLPPEEAEVYVWHNLRPRPDPDDPVALWQRLLVDLHEMQYLAPSVFGLEVGDPVGLYLAVTGSGEVLVGSGLVSEGDLRKLAELVGDRYRLERIRDEAGVL